MKEKNIYTQVMYKAIHELKHRDSYYYENGNPKDNIISSLIQTNHQYLVNEVLDSDMLSSQKYTEILNSYFQAGKFKEILELFQEYANKDHNFDIRNFGKELLKGNYDEDYILSFASYISLGEKAIQRIYRLLKDIWQIKDFPLAQKIIHIYLPKENQEIFLIIDKIYQGIFPTFKEISTATDNLINLPIDSKDKRREEERRKKVCIFLLRELGKNNADIDILETTLLMYKKKKLEDMFSNTEFIEKKIKNYYFERAEFDKAEAFIEATDDYGFHKREVTQKKYKYAIKTGNKKLHKECMKLYIKKYEKELKEYKENWDLGLTFQEQLQNTEINESLDDDENEILEEVRENRSYFYYYSARKYSELAIFELLHGKPEKAQEYINLMIENTENITRNIPNGGTQRNRNHIKGRIKLPLKKELKEKFLELDLFHFLPSDIGWNHPIKHQDQRALEYDTRYERREIEDKKNRKIMENIELEKERKKIISLKKILENGDLEEALDFVNNSINRHSDQPDWERAMLVLDTYPESFEKLFEIVSKDCFDENIRNVGGYQKYKFMNQFFIKAHKLGVVKKSDWEMLVEKINKFRFASDRNKVTIPRDISYSLIKYLIDADDISQAWNIFEKFRNLDLKYRGTSIDDTTINEILSLFIKATTNTERRNGAYFAFNNLNLENEDNLSVIEQGIYWNTQANIASVFQDEEKYENSSLELHKIIANSDNPTSVIRNRCRDLLTNCMRTPHQIKNEMTDLLNSDFGKIEKIRRRIIYTLIELKNPGIEAMTDIKKKDTPERIQYLYFKKLIEKGFLTSKTNRYLGKDWKAHIPYLRRLLAQYQNEFNTVIQTMESEILTNNREDILNNPVTNWKNILKVLKIIGTITPGIWAQANAVNFNESKLIQLSKKIRVTKKEMFKNEPISEDITRELQAEIIYQAFKPGNMSHLDVNHLLDNFNDYSHHLDKYVFPEEGYPINIIQRSNVVLRRYKMINKNLNYIYQAVKKSIDESNFHTFLESRSIKEEKGTEKEFIQKTGRQLIKCGRFKIDTFERKGLEKLLYLFIKDSYFSNINNLNISDTNDRYSYLLQIKDFFNLYIIDNLEEKIRLFYYKNRKYLSRTWQSFIQALKTPKYKYIIKNQLQMELPDVIDDRFGAYIISQIIIKKTKIITQIKRQISNELDKYVYINGEEIINSNIKLRAYVSKNKASFFAKASAGLCTSTDIESFKREDHFHINTVDDTKQECLGNLMAYEISHKGEKTLLLRGFNPNTNLLKEIDIPSYCEAMIDVATQFAKENGFTSIYMTEILGGWHALSNRNEVTKYLMKKYGEKGEEFKFNIAYNTEIKKIYHLKRIKEKLEKAA